MFFTVDKMLRHLQLERLAQDTWSAPRGLRALLEIAGNEYSDLQRLRTTRFQQLLRFLYQHGVLVSYQYPREALRPESIDKSPGIDSLIRIKLADVNSLPAVVAPPISTKSSETKQEILQLLSVMEKSLKQLRVKVSGLSDSDLEEVKPVIQQVLSNEDDSVEVKSNSFANEMNDLSDHRDDGGLNLFD